MELPSLDIVVIVCILDFTALQDIPNLLSCSRFLCNRNLNNYITNRIEEVYEPLVLPKTLKAPTQLCALSKEKFHTAMIRQWLDNSNKEEIGYRIIFFRQISKIYEETNIKVDLFLNDILDLPLRYVIAWTDKTGSKYYTPTRVMKAVLQKDNVEKFKYYLRVYKLDLQTAIKEYTRESIGPNIIQYLLIELPDTYCIPAKRVVVWISACQHIAMFDNYFRKRPDEIRHFLLHIDKYYQGVDINKLARLCCITVSLLLELTNCPYVEYEKTEIRKFCNGENKSILKELLLKKLIN